MFFFFFFNDTATTEIYTLSLHDALPIFQLQPLPRGFLLHGLGQLQVERVLLREQGHADGAGRAGAGARLCKRRADRKSTRLNSSHQIISYAVFCLKKKTRTEDRVSPSTR